jgi:hypothetical protein
MWLNQFDEIGNRVALSTNQIIRFYSHSIFRSSQGFQARSPSSKFVLRESRNIFCHGRFTSMSANGGLMRFVCRHSFRRRKEVASEWFIGNT